MRQLGNGPDLNNSFHSTKLPSEHRAHKLLNGVLSELTKSQPQKEMPSFFWGADHFRLDQTSLWKTLKLDQQSRILRLLSERNLASSWWIENSGRNYGAKMILLSESNEEKSLYSLFCAEETIHMREFEHFIDFKLDWDLHAHPMLTSLGQAIENADRDTLLLVVQVLLEGFGLAHYQSLREKCLSPNLMSAYDRILKDEARHHGTGVIFAQEIKPSSQSLDQMFTFTRSFIKSFIDVKWIQDAIEREKDLSEGEKVQLHQELSTDEINTSRRKRFKDMLMKVDSFGLVKKLEADSVL